MPKSRQTARVRTLGGAGREIVGCGGWSRRQTLFGGNHTGGRDASFLDPATDAAPVRAMYTRPDWTRRGIGRLIIELCEAAAREAGFSRTRLTATLSGEPLYLACGYRPVERVEVPTAKEITVPLIRMEKSICDPGEPEERFTVCRFSLHLGESGPKWSLSAIESTAYPASSRRPSFNTRDVLSCVLPARVVRVAVTTEEGIR